MTESMNRPTTLSSYLHRQHKEFKPTLRRSKLETIPEPPMQLTTLAEYLARQRKEVKLH